MAKFLVIDPGREKTGMAIMNEAGEVMRHEIIPSDQLLPIMESLIVDESIAYLVMGNGTSSKEKVNLIKNTFAEMELKVVDEYATTEEGRRIYFQMNPPKGLKRLIPLGMQVPPGPIDDYAAIAIGRRYLKTK